VAGKTHRCDRGFSGWYGAGHHRHYPVHHGKLNRAALALIASDFVYHPAEGKLEYIEREDFLSFDEKCMKRVYPLSLYGSRHPGLSRIGQT